MTRNIKIRIAVVISGDGSWSACGDSGIDDTDAMTTAEEDLGADCPAHYWLEADLEVPEVRTVVAVVRGET